MITKKHKKHIDKYSDDFTFAISNLTEDILAYLDIAKSDQVSHNEITRTVNLIDWTARQVAYNTDELKEALCKKNQ